MRLSDDTTNAITEEVYNHFDRFEEPNVSAVDVAATFNTTRFLAVDYRGIRFSDEALVNALLFKRLKRFGKDTQLVRYLENHPDEARTLGFYRDADQELQVPDQRTLSHFRNNALDEHDSAVLAAIVEEIEQVADRFGVVFDVATVHVPDDVEEKAERTQHEIWWEKSEENWRRTKRKLYPVLDIPEKKNCVHGSNRVLDFVSAVVAKRDSISNVSWSVNFSTPMPHGDTVLHRIKQFDSATAIQDEFRAAFERLWRMAESANVFDRRKVNVAIDYTEVPYYGDKDDPMVRGIKYTEDIGTRWGFKFATICIVDRHRRFNLLTLPVGTFDERDEIVEELLDYAMERVRINHVYLDREFFAASTINLLQRKGLDFIMPATRTSRVKEVAEVMPANSAVRNFEMKDATFNLFLTEGDKPGTKHVFATNIAMNEFDEARAERLATAYSQRWGVESSYRVVKNSFMPRTSTKDYQVRLFLFLYANLFYNLWILIDLLICMGRKNVPEEHTIYATFIGNVITELVQERTEDPPLSTCL